MEIGSRKTIEVEVFDFEQDQFAYAPKSGKNLFGYKVKKSKVLPTGRLEVIEERNNVEEYGKIYKKFGLNLSQMRSLKRVVKAARKNGKIFIIPFPEKGKIEVVFRNGNSVTYKGEHPEEFCQKVFKKVR